MSWLAYLFCGSKTKSNKVSPEVFQAFIMDAIKMDIPEALKSITEDDQNAKCVDCGTAEPVWASLGFGTLVCLKCAGFHRSLGTHITSVRAVKLDSWTPEHIQKIKVGGNSAFNKHCGDVSMASEEFLSMVKYGNPKILYYR